MPLRRPSFTSSPLPNQLANSYTDSCQAQSCSPSVLVTRSTGEPANLPCQHEAISPDLPSGHSSAYIKAPQRESPAYGTYSDCGDAILRQSEAMASLGNGAFTSGSPMPCLLSPAYTSGCNPFLPPIHEPRAPDRLRSLADALTDCSNQQLSFEEGSSQPNRSAASCLCSSSASSSSSFTSASSSLSSSSFTSTSSLSIQSALSSLEQAMFRPLDYVLAKPGSYTSACDQMLGSQGQAPAIGVLNNQLLMQPQEQAYWLQPSRFTLRGSRLATARRLERQGRTEQEELERFGDEAVGLGSTTSIDWLGSPFEASAIISDHSDFGCPSIQLGDQATKEASMGNAGTIRDFGACDDFGHYLEKRIRACGPDFGAMID
ncbi:unnamed protein product [Protopolystoma xenopodis]|uniref:Uncharacterized protein n=1 Tax=Protopolystoma xenopodis TaxID=117903 RepID=A0A448WAI3_9PLAT|nr:unnamed protein product [Protopolystoma xenopodis]